MKLDIEALAREAGIFERLTPKGMEQWHADATRELEAFARLIVEKCAVVAESVEDQNRHIGESPASAWEQGTLDSAEAIRQLLEDK